VSKIRIKKSDLQEAIKDILNEQQRTSPSGLAREAIGAATQAIFQVYNKYSSQGLEAVDSEWKMSIAHMLDVQIRDALVEMYADLELDESTSRVDEFQNPFKKLPQREELVSALAQEILSSHKLNGRIPSYARAKKLGHNNFDHAAAVAALLASEVGEWLESLKGTKKLRHNSSKIEPDTENATIKAIGDAVINMYWEKGGWDD